MLDFPPKGPTEAADYLIDFAGALQPGETIVSKMVAAVGVTADAGTIVGSAVRLWLSGGVEGAAGRVTVTIVTNSTPARTLVETAIVPIGGGPVSLATVKAHLRVDFDTDDLLILAYLRGAVAAVEKMTGRVLSSRVIEQRIDDFAGPGGGSRILLSGDPVQELVSINYLDAAGATVTLGAGGYRVVAGEPYWLLPPLNGSWPSVLGETGAVRVRYLAGYLPGDVPGELVAAVLMLVGHYYSNREAVGSDSVTEVPMGVRALCFPFRRILIG